MNFNLVYYGRRVAASISVMRLCWTMLRRVFARRPNTKAPVANLNAGDV